MPTMHLPKDEKEAMLRNRRRSQGEYYQMFKSKLKNRICCYFCIGFILSAILALSAYVLSYGIWALEAENKENSNEKLTTLELLSSTNVPTTTTTTSPADNCQRRLVGYYTHWETPTLDVKQLQNLTHIVYMFGFIQEDGSVRVDNGNCHECEKRWLVMKNTTRTEKKGLKILLAVGGHFSSKQFESTLADPVRKEKLLTSIMDQLEKYDIDGIEIHWTFPSAKDSVPHAELTKEVRKRMTTLKNAKGRVEDYVLSTVTSRYKDKRENILYNEIMKYVDFVTVLPYKWNAPVGPISPLNGYDEDSVHAAIQDLTCKTKTPSKLNLGISIFGIHWNNISFPLNDDKRQMYTPNDGGKSSHSIIFGRDKHNPGAWVNAKPYWHNRSRTPYIWDAKERVFVSFENARSLKEKSDYAWMKNLGGVTVYVLEQDHNNTMLAAASSAEQCQEFEKDSVQFECPI